MTPEEYSKLIGFTKWKIYRLTGSSKEPLDILHSAYLRNENIYKAITNECFLLLKKKWVENQHKYGFNPPEQKQCNKCNQILSISEFRIFKELKLDVKRVRFICKKCENKYQQKYHKKHKQKMKDFVNNLDKKLLQQIENKYNTTDKRKIYSICKKFYN
jgi:DNA-directed RNA polymerase subunit M/transcription elongation factor TFIIS